MGEAVGEAVSRGVAVGVGEPGGVGVGDARASEKVSAWHSNSAAGAGRGAVGATAWRRS